MKLKSTLLLLILFTGLTLTSQPPGIYDYAMVYSTGAQVLVVTNHGADKYNVCKGCNYNSQLILKVNELSRDGWEVLNADVMGSNSRTPVFYLRKKKA